MKFIFLFLLFSHAHAHAQESLDQRLSGYIKAFDLRAQQQPPTRNEELFSLGRRLFHEREISGNKNIACLTCHHPRVMTHDALPLALGEGAKGLQIGENLRIQHTARIGARNTLALFNLHNVHVMFWDGRVEFAPETKTFLTPVPLPPEVSKTLTSALAAQAIFPLVDHNEMRGLPGSNDIANAKDVYEAWGLIVKRLLKIPFYQETFQHLFPGETINIGHVGEALAEFQAHAFFYADTPYDRYLQGNVSALSPKQKKGMDVFFGKGKCGDCHRGEHLSALDFDGVASPQIGPGNRDGDDLGRFEWDQDEDSRYAFRVSPLRNVGLTAPYFHSGAMKNLEDVVEHYNDIKMSLESFRIMGHLQNYLTPLKDHDHGTNTFRYALLPDDLPLRLNLSESEKDALVDFMRFGLTDVRLHENL